MLAVAELSAALGIAIGFCLSRESAWWWLGSPVIAFGLLLLLIYLPQLIEFLLIHVFRCPACGARRWSWGFTKGFGH